MENRKRTVDVEELRRLGVPEVFIETAEYYSQRGAFDDEPSPELLENTIAQCLGELRKRPETELPGVPDVVITNQAAYAQARESTRGSTATLFSVTPINRACKRSKVPRVNLRTM